MTGPSRTPSGYTRHTCSCCGLACPWGAGDFVCPECARETPLSRKQGCPGDRSELTRAQVTKQVIYAVGDGVVRAFKVGTTIDLDRRLKALRTDKTIVPAAVDRLSLRVLHQVRGGLLREQLIHFRLQRARTVGEWFACPLDEICDAMDSVAANSKLS